MITPDCTFIGRNVNYWFLKLNHPFGYWNASAVNNKNACLVSLSVRIEEIWGTIHRPEIRAIFPPTVALGVVLVGKSHVPKKSSLRAERRRELNR